MNETQEAVNNLTEAQLGTVVQRHLTVFGEWLKRRRARLGLTQKLLAEKAEIDVMTISKWERGDIVNPQPATIGKLAHALGLDSDVIFEVIADSEKLFAKSHERRTAR